MAEIKYTQDLELDDTLAKSIHGLVGKSLREANSRHPIYNNNDLGAFINVFNPDRIRSWLPRDISSYFAFDGDELVGTAFLGHRQDDFDIARAYLSGMYVDPDYQHGYKIGSQLLDSVVGSAKRNDLRTIRAYSTLFPETLAFYERNGFTKLELKEFIQSNGNPLMFQGIELDLTRRV